MIPDLQKAVIVITGSRAENFGTGFVIHKTEVATYIVTCTHVIDDVGGPDELKADQLPASVVDSDLETGFDLAVIKIDRPLDTPVFLMGDKTSQNQAVTIIGCHLIGKQRVIQPIDGHLIKQGEVESTKLKSRSTCWHLQINSGYPLQPGYSGAPMIDPTTGRVLGIVNLRKGTGGSGLAISAEAIARIWSEMPPQLLPPPEPKRDVLGMPEAGPLMNCYDELSTFRQMAQLPNNAIRLISLYGTSGMGKSRLIREYQRIAAEFNLDVLKFDLKQQIDVEGCLDQMITRFGFQNFHQFHQFSSTGRPDPFTRAKEQEWYRNLTRNFLLDLVGIQNASRLLVMFDHLEKADGAFKWWLNNAFLPRIITSLPITVVVAGHEDIQMDPSWSGQKRFKLNGLTPDYFFDYASHHQISMPPDLMEVAYEVSQGCPKNFVAFIEIKIKQRSQG